MVELAAVSGVVSSRVVKSAVGSAETDSDPADFAACSAKMGSRAVEFAVGCAEMVCRLVMLGRWR